MLVLRYFLTSYPYCDCALLFSLIFSAHWPEFKLVLQEDQWSPFSSASKHQVFWWIIFLWHFVLGFFFLLFSWRMCSFFRSFINSWSCHLRINNYIFIFNLYVFKGCITVPRTFGTMLHGCDIVNTFRL